MGFCRPDSAHCHLKTPHLQCPRTWPVGRPPHRPSQPGRLTPPQPTPPPGPCSAVLCGVWRFSGVFASAGIWRPRGKWSSKMHFVPRELSKRWAIAAATPPCAILVPRTRAPQVSSDSRGGATARDIRPTLRYLHPHGHIHVVAWSVTTFEPA